MEKNSERLWELFKSKAVKLSVEAFNKGYKLGLEHGQLLGKSLNCQERNGDE